MDVLHVTNPNKPCKENNRQRRAIVFDKFSNVALEKVAFTD